MHSDSLSSETNPVAATPEKTARGRFQAIIEFLNVHKLGALAVLSAILLSLPGINWGVFECWNLDQMGHVKLQPDGLPKNYLKPPLLTYLNQALLLPVVQYSLEKGFRIRKSKQPAYHLLASRLLTLAMFAASVALLYFAALRSGSREAAGVAALLYATSSGILVFNRFLTADSPLLFWMVSSLFFAIKCAEERKLAWAILSGLLAGLATAMKYNGLWAGAALPMALFVSMGFRMFAWRGFWLGGISMPAGFVLGNPGALFDFRRFFEDFYYNLKTTPVYEGQSEGHGYLKFFANWPDLVGWPAALILGIGILAAVYGLAARKTSLSQRLLLFTAAAVFLLYYLSIGSFPRMAARFVLPSMPFVFLMAAVGFAFLPWRFRALQIAVLLALVYNVASSLEAGVRFINDPRMPAWAWVKNHIPENAVIENSYAPHWRRMPGYRPTVVRMPTVTGRSELFGKMFEGDPIVQATIQRHETAQDAVKMFTREALKERNPDFIAFTSQVFEFSGDEQVQRFYGLLDAGQLGYHKVYEKRWREPAAWSYPRGIDFLVQRMVILQRSEGQEQTQQPSAE